jgi:2-polyprenyl-3-methyl-5-hydroxy-6-metoxy-1,4-benzoquinol methylase
MQHCVPYVCAERRDVQQAREDQRLMVLHAIDTAAGKDYYDNNPGDRPFEEQYGLQSAGEIFQGIPRFAAALRALMSIKGVEKPRVLDLACNDGILAQALSEVGSGFEYTGIDLSQACIDRARARGLGRAEFACGSILDLGRTPERLSSATVATEPASYQLVVMFEVLEHVLEPERFLNNAYSMVAPGGSLMVSTPLGAVERGELPHWDRVEPKGHIWAFTDKEFTNMLEALDGAQGVQVVLGGDGVMIGTVTR